jgi:hypothetical protein
VLTGSEKPEGHEKDTIYLYQDLRRHTTYSVPKKGNRIFSPTAIVQTIKKFNRARNHRLFYQTSVKRIAGYLSSFLR